MNDILDRLRDEQPRLYGDAALRRAAVSLRPGGDTASTSTASRRASRCSWTKARTTGGSSGWAAQLGWTGVALKTCKTQTGALLSALLGARPTAWTLMVQDLTNPMLAQIPHVLLAAHAGTIMGVETNAMQFYPEASRAEAEVHPGLYRRRGGVVDLSTIAGPGFGYRVEEIGRHVLPEPAVGVGRCATRLLPV